MKKLLSLALLASLLIPTITMAADSSSYGATSVTTSNSGSGAGKILVTDTISTFKNSKTAPNAGNNKSYYHIDDNGNVYYTYCTTGGCYADTYQCNIGAGSCNVKSSSTSAYHPYFDATFKPTPTGLSITSTTTGGCSMAGCTSTSSEAFQPWTQ